MLISLVLLLLQLGSVTVGTPGEGPKSLWELTMVSNGGAPLVHTACEPQLMDDAKYIKGVDDLDPKGARCSAPVLTQTPDGWVREKTCTEGGRTVVVHASRKGDPARDVTYATSLRAPGRAASWSISTRMRNLGACPKE